MSRGTRLLHLVRLVLAWHVPLGDAISVVDSCSRASVGRVEEQAQALILGNYRLASNSKSRIRGQFNTRPISNNRSSDDSLLHKVRVVDGNVLRNTASHRETEQVDLFHFDSLQEGNRCVTLGRDRVADLASAVTDTGVVEQDNGSELSNVIEK